MSDTILSRQERKCPGRERRLLTAIFFFFLSLYLLTSSGQLLIIDENAMYLVAKSIAEKGNFEIIPQIQGVPYKGKFYAFYGIGTSIVMLPFYLTGKLLNNYLPAMPGDGVPKAMVSLAPALITALTCLVFYLFSGLFGYSRKVSLLLTLIYGLTTMAWHYSKHFYSDVPTGLFLLCGVYLLVLFNKKSTHSTHPGLRPGVCSGLILSGLSLPRPKVRGLEAAEVSKQADRGGLFLSGLFFGFSAACRLETLLFSALAALYLLCSLKRDGRSPAEIARGLAIFCLPVALILFFIALYNYARFGSFIETGYGIWGKLSIYNLGMHATALALGVKSPWTSFLIGIYGYFFSSGKSIFLYSPVLFLSLFGLKKLYRQYPYEVIFFLAMFFVNIIIHSNLIAPYTAGWSWANRYLLTTLPFLILPAGFVFKEWRAIKKPAKSAAVIIILLSLTIQIASVLVDPQRYVLEFKKKEGIGFDSNREWDWGKASYDIRYSPLLGQFSSLSHVIRNMASGRSREFPAMFSREERAAMDEVDLNLNSLQLNTLNFWWVKLHYLGFSKRILGLTVSVLLAIFLSSSVYIFHYLKRPFKNEGD